MIGTIGYTRYDMTTHSAGFIIQVASIVYGTIGNIIKTLGPDMVGWIVLIFLSIIALSATIKSSSVVAVILCAVAALFVVWGMLGIGTAVLGIAMLFAIFAMMRKGA